MTIIELFSGIASAIRNKNGSTNTFTPNNFATEISKLGPFTSYSLTVITNPNANVTAMNSNLSQPLSGIANSEGILEMSLPYTGMWSITSTYSTLTKTMNIEV